MKNIIFVFRTTALFSYSSSIINEINKKENKVTLVFIRESTNGSTMYRIKINKDTGLKELVSENPILNRSEVLVSESEKISIIKGKERSDRWTYPLRIIRETVSLMSYIKRGNKSAYYLRQKRRVPKIITNWITSKIFGKYLSPLGTINRVLKLINNIIPVSNEIKTFLDSLKGNCVVVVGANYATDPTYFSSGNDYIKACSALKIPSVVQIVSWDNLTTKGLYHYKPTLMLAWNKAHKEEAINIHGIPKERIAITGSPFMDKWFNHKSTIRTKNEFFSALSLNPNDPLVTYLGSSKNIVGEEEAAIAEKLFQNLRRKGIQMIIRPHGANSEQFKSLASKIPVIPEEGDLPDTSDAKRLMVETMSYSSATVGINTTAMIDSIILGTPSVTLLKKEFDLGQSLTQHFENLRKTKIFPEAINESDASDILEKIIGDPQNFKEKQEFQEFISNFCRPEGIGISAGKVSSELIISLTNTGYEDNKSILFLLRDASLFSYSDSIISEVRNSKSKITLCIMRENTSGSTKYFLEESHGKKHLVAESLSSSEKETLISENSNLKIIRGIKRDDFWIQPTKFLRESLNLLSYIRRGDSGTFFENQKKYTNSYIKFILSVPILNSLIAKSRILEFTLRFMHILIPASKNLKKFLADQECSTIVIVGANWPSSSNNYSSEVDYVKAAKRLNINTVIQVVSWDNLTARGLYHYEPDLLFAWNRQHALEAENVHHIKKDHVVVTGSPFMDKWFSKKLIYGKRDEFNKSIGIDIKKPLVTYLGSSGNVSRDEKQIVEKLYQELDRKGMQLIVRPHGANYKQFDNMNPKIKIIPRSGDLPDTFKSKQLMVQTITNSVATVGINTTAMLDSLIIGTPCFAITKKEFQKYQMETYHFKKIIDYDLLQITTSELECSQKIEEFRIDSSGFKDKRETFIKHFCRPYGLEISAGFLAANAIFLIDKYPSKKEFKENLKNLLK
ncbi:MAG: hypothetical protein VX359_01290 [Chloroflexota bacterium]